MLLPLLVKCPHCQNVLRLSDELRNGGTVTCKYCNNSFLSTHKTPPVDDNILSPKEAFYNSGKSGGMILFRDDGIVASFIQPWPVWKTTSIGALLTLIAVVIYNGIQHVGMPFYGSLLTVFLAWWVVNFFSSPRVEEFIPYSDICAFEIDEDMVAVFLCNRKHSLLFAKADDAMMAMFKEEFFKHSVPYGDPHFDSLSMRMSLIQRFS